MTPNPQDDIISIIVNQFKEAVNDHTNAPPLIPSTLPLMPIRDVVIFTDMLLPLFVARKKSVQALEEAASGSGYLFLTAQKDPYNENPQPDDIYALGTVCRVLRLMPLPDGQVKALLQGVSRGRILRYLRRKPFYRVKIELVIEAELPEISLEVEALMRNVREQTEKMLSYRDEMNDEVHAVLEQITHPGKLADIVASNLYVKPEDAQVLLEITDPLKRLRKVSEVLNREVQLSSVQARIQSDVHEEIAKHQKDYYLREQMRIINRELGEEDDQQKELDSYRKQIRRARMSQEAEAEALKQLRRLEQMHSDSAESTVVRTYLDWLVELPWSKSSKDVVDIQKVRQILDQDHYGLEKVKDRILEYLSVRKLNARMKGPILCFVGPPGVGKTSLGRSIARATRRKFVRISLGGIRDEAEIRGHRRTYIGALPGRILQGLKQCGTNNPVFMMDEIDKLGNDFRGDPSAALLEALDPEQNMAFSDHYLNLAFDLSRVMFILTANTTDYIPSALLDRMEIIQLNGYSNEEKLSIAQNYLIPRQIKDNGLKRRQIIIHPLALEQIITEYTSEAGLRNLEREIATVCRKIARQVAENVKGPFKITRASLPKYLGVAKYYPEIDQEESQVGLATGLAWTQVGGEVMYVEAGLIGGKGDLILTGQLGEVMQESARAALSYARSHLNTLGIAENNFETFDVHIHVPSGATPKDGPSAGIAMAAALISALTQRPVNNAIAMTGEITLRGRVLPIGGLREKALGALRAGIKTIIIPFKNKHDLAEIPANIKRKLKFVTVKNMDEVLELALEKKEGKSKKQSSRHDAEPSQSEPSDNSSHSARQ